MVDLQRDRHNRCKLRALSQQHNIFKLVICNGLYAAEIRCKIRKEVIEILKFY